MTTYKVNRFLLIGGGELLLWCRDYLLGDSYDVVAVTSKRHSANTPGVRVISSLSELEVTPTTLGMSIGSAWIFGQRFINAFSGKLLNFHGRPLPRYRGGGGFSWQIMRDDRQGCCLIHEVDAGIDTGRVVKRHEFVYPGWCRIPTDYVKLFHAQSKAFLAEFLDSVNSGAEFELTEQDEQEAQYWPRLSTEKQAYIDWNWSAEEIARFICAFDEPYSGAGTFYSKAPRKKVRLKGCSVVDAEHFHPFQWGLVYKVMSGALFIAVKGGTLRVDSVTNAYGSQVDISVGERFYTPTDVLERAVRCRPVYTPEGEQL